MQKTILIVDDDRLNLMTAQKLLAEDYKVVGVNSGKQTFMYLEKYTPDLILLDIIMPEMDGFEVMKRLQEDKNWCHIPVIFLTADTKVETEAEGLKLGAHDFITKPFEPSIMMNRIRRTLELEGYRRDLQAQLDDKAKEVERVTIQAITTVANTIDAKDDYTKGHSSRVAYYAEELARKLGWSEEDALNVHYVALLHDIGKIGVPDSVLNKPFKLTDVEFELIKGHTLMGAEILKDIRMFPNVDVGAKYHHERYDGTGYPEGLKGEAIPEVARVIGIADSYDAMTSNRVYRKKLRDEVVKTELIKGRGSQFDPKMVDAFMELLDEKDLYESVPEADMVMPIFESDKIFGGVTKTEVGLDSSEDYLTGLLSKEQGEKEIKECLYNGSGCLMLLDLNHFKDINEKYGHLAGDYALKIVADVLKDVSQKDIVCRIGGDEFVYFVEGIRRQSEAKLKVEQIINAYEIKKQEASILKDVSLSIGISISGIDGSDYDELMRKADKALYLVKQTRGREVYTFYRTSDYIKTHDQSLEDLRNLENMIMNHESYSGAFRVEYEEFERIYDFVQHFSKRNRQEMQLVLFTLFTANGSDFALENMDQAMQCMEQAIIKSLRGVDVGTRYSSSQFVVVLIGAGRKDIQVIVDRIVQNYFKLYGKRDITLAYDVADFSEDK